MSSLVSTRIAFSSLLEVINDYNIRMPTLKVSAFECLVRDDIEVLPTATAKIQQWVRHFANFYRFSPEARFERSFAHRTKLAYLPLCSDRAAYALHLLERVDPHFCAINFERSLMLRRGVIDKKSAAYERYRKYVQMEFKPLKLAFPVCPYQHPALARPVVLKREEISSLFWKIVDCTMNRDDECYRSNLTDISKQQGFKIKLMPERHR